MKFIIEVREIQSDHILAVPEFLKNIYIEANSREEVKQYILKNLKDGYGNKFKATSAEEKRTFKVDFKSITGSIVLKEYKELKFKNISTKSMTQSTKEILKRGYF